jgi:hypothetical protein
MPAPDDFTKTLLHRIQDERTTPSGGWLDIHQMASLMGVSQREAMRLGGPLQELFEAGMIERRFNATKARDEWRSRGVRPDLPAPESNAHDQLDGVVIPRAITIPRADRPGRGYYKAVDDLDDAVDKWLSEKPEGLDGYSVEDLFDALVNLGWTPPASAR